MPAQLGSGDGHAAPGELRRGTGGQSAPAELGHGAGGQSAPAELQHGAGNCRTGRRVDCCKSRRADERH